MAQAPDWRRASGIAAIKPQWRYRMIAVNAVNAERQRLPEDERVALTLRRQRQNVRPIAVFTPPNAFTFASSAASTGSSTDSSSTASPPA